MHLAKCIGLADLTDHRESNTRHGIRPTHICTAQHLSSSPIVSHRTIRRPFRDRLPCPEVLDFSSAPEPRREEGIFTTTPLSSEEAREEAAEPGRDTCAGSDAEDGWREFQEPGAPRVMGGEAPWSHPPSIA